MSIRYNIDMDRQLVVVRYEDWLDPTEYVNFIVELAANPDYSPQFRALSILSPNINLNKMNIQSLQSMLVAEATNLKRPPGSLVVIFADDWTAKFIAKLYRDLAASTVNLKSDIRIVASAQEAADILGVSLDHISIP